jgi:hypothetical protein
MPGRGLSEFSDPPIGKNRRESTNHGYENSGLTLNAISTGN